MEVLFWLGLALLNMSSLYYHVTSGNTAWAVVSIVLIVSCGGYAGQAFSERKK